MPDGKTGLIQDAVAAHRHLPGHFEPSGLLLGDIQQRRADFMGVQCCDRHEATEEQERRRQPQSYD